MTSAEKLIQRFLKFPSDFSFAELTKLLAYYGYHLETAGKTSGSRMRFIKQGAPPILIHRPHTPNAPVKQVVLKAIAELLNLKGQ